MENYGQNIKIPLGDVKPKNIKLGGYEFEVRSKKEWVFNLGDGDSVAQLFIVDGCILMMKADGKLNKEVIRKITDKVIKLASKTGESLSLIMDLHIPYLSRDTRKSIFSAEKELREHFDSYYLVSDGRSRSIVKIYKTLHPTYGNILKSARSISAALLDIKKDLEKKTDEILDVLKLIPEAADYPMDLNWEGNFIHVEHQKTWNYSDQQFTFAGYLVNDKIFIHRSTGTIDERAMLIINEIGREIYSKVPPNQLVVVSDLQHVHKLSKKARQILAKINSKAHEARKIEYSVPNQLMSAIMTIHQLMKPELKKKLVLCSNFETAVRRSLKKINPEDQELSLHDEKSVGKMSSEELKDALLKEQEKRLELERRHKEYIDWLIEKIGSITWKEKTEFLENLAPEDDPFHDLINSFNFLQKDINERLEQIKSYKKSHQDKS